MGGGGGEPSWGEVLSSRPAQLGMALFVFQQFRCVLGGGAGRAFGGLVGGWVAAPPQPTDTSATHTHLVASHAEHPHHHSLPSSP